MQKHYLLSNWKEVMSEAAAQNKPFCIFEHLLDKPREDRYFIDSLRLLPCHLAKEWLLEKRHPWYAYLYTAWMLGERWPEAEEFIKLDPESAFGYAWDVVGGKWQEAEEAILRFEGHSGWCGYYYPRNRATDPM
jgi:hypothetical protein